jgi:hypothetical protein
MLLIVQAMNMGFSGIFMIVPLILGAFILFFYCEAPAGQLLKNPGFNGPAIRGVAVCWRDDSAWAGVEYLQDDDAIDGKSQHILSRQVTSGAVQLIQSNVTLSKDNNYEVGIWAKGKIGEPIELMLGKRDSPQKIYAQNLFRITEQWEYYHFIAKVGVDDSDACFIVRLTSQGDVWLDEASLKKVIHAENKTSIDSYNLIANGSFEVGLDRWAVKVREAGGYRYQMPVEYEDIRPIFVSKDVPQGNQALYLEVPPHGRAIVTTKLLEKHPGSLYSVSLWLKSNEPDRKVIINLSTGFGDKTSQVKEVSVGQSWKRFGFSAVLISDQYHLVIETMKQGGLYVDGVQVVPINAELSQYSHPVEIGFTRSSGTPLFNRGEIIDLEFCLSLYQSSEKPLVVKIYTTDIFGIKDLLFEQEYSRNVKKDMCESFSHPSKQTGYFQINATVEDSDGLIDQAKMAIGILSKTQGLQNPGSPFGGHAKFSPENLKAVKMLGVSWLRMHPPMGTKWFVVEPQKGHIEYFDKSIMFAKRQGFNILGTLHGSPRWASSAPANVTSELMNGFPSYPPKNIDDWERYVARTVSHFKGVIDDWEVWNEPDTSGFLKINGLAADFRIPSVYVDLVAAAYRAAKKANPQVRIVAGVGTRKPPIRWVEKIIDRGVLDYMDVLSFHFYTDGRSVDKLDATGRYRVNELRVAMMKARPEKNIPIWETESGYRMDVCNVDVAEGSAEYCETPEQSVAFIVRNYIEWISSGVEHWFFYNMFFPDRTDRPDFSGFFNWDRSPTPLAIGYAVASRMLVGMKYLNSFSLSEGVKGARFKSHDRSIRVLWATDNNLERNTRVAVAIDPDSHEVRVINSMGNKIERYVQNGAISVDVSVAPIYVVEVYKLKSLNDNGPL